MGSTRLLLYTARRVLLIVPVLLVALFLTFALTRIVRDCDDVLVCRMADGKVTFVHRRLWPALIRLADRFPHERLAQLREEHTPSGRHIVRTTAFPDWVSRDVSVLAGKLSEAEALAQIGRLLM